jgi:cob(I)alamin adenosyltransferase
MNQRLPHEGRVQIYCGDGKGKTSAAVGAAVRAAGAGFGVCFVQFNKDGTSSELKILRDLPRMEVISGKPSTRFTWEMNEAELAETRAINNRYFMQGMAAATATAQMVIFDELCSAFDLALIDRAMVLRALRQRPADVEFILTGRNPAPELLELADYISEIAAVRHPFQKRIGARLGIEY